jgi:ABC-type nitrate/sulfonate/bicarbonate transport system substrate-binding protein
MRSKIMALRYLPREFVKAAVIAVILSAPSLAMAQQTIRIGQGVPTLSFLPLWSARALNTFAAEGLTANAVVMPGGDAAALAALDAGDIDLAAVGSETVMRAFAKGQPFEMVYSLMSKVTLEFVAAPALLDRAGVKPGAPLPERLAALKGAVVGVAAIGGAQEAAARWLAAKGGLDPKTDIKVAQVGNPVAIQAALENKRIDAFVLSPPEGYIAEKAGSGKVVVSFGSEFPELANQPYLVLAVKTPVDDAKSALIVKTVRAMQAASAALRDKPEETALAIQKQFFPKADPDAIVTAIKSLSSGTADGGKLDAEGVRRALGAAKDVGIDFGKTLDARGSEDKLWTNRFVAAAKGQ